MPTIIFRTPTRRDAASQPALPRRDWIENDNDPNHVPFMLRAGFWTDLLTSPTTWVGAASTAHISIISLMASSLKMGDGGQICALAIMVIYCIMVQYCTLHVWLGTKAQEIYDQKYQIGYSIVITNAWFMACGLASVNSKFDLMTGTWWFAILPTTAWIWSVIWSMNVPRVPQDV